MILREILDSQMGMLSKELVHPFTFMPPGMIDPQLYHRFLESVKNMGKKGQESIGISSLLPNHPVPPLYRVNPPKDIEALLMLSLAEAGQMGVTGRDLGTAVAQVDLKLAQILTLLQEGGGVGMAQRVDVSGLLDAAYTQSQPEDGTLFA